MVIREKIGGLAAATWEHRDELQRTAVTAGFLMSFLPHEPIRRAGNLLWMGGMTSYFIGDAARRFQEVTRMSQEELRRETENHLVNIY